MKLSKKWVVVKKQNKKKATKQPSTNKIYVTPIFKGCKGIEAIEKHK